MVPMIQEALAPRPERTVQIENEKVLVVMWRFPPGACLDWHRHAGRAEAKLIANRPYARYAGVEHRVENRGEHEIVWVEIDLKTRKLP